MSVRLSSLYTASALGVGNDASLASCLCGEAPGMREIEGDIPGRRIWFGHVPGDLPRIAEPRWNMRSNGLIQLALDSESAFADLVRRYGADRVGVVLGASNTGIDEAQRYIDEWLSSGAESPPPDSTFQ